MIAGLRQPYSCAGSQISNDAWISSSVSGRIAFCSTLTLGCR